MQAKDVADKLMGVSSDGSVTLKPEEVQSLQSDLEELKKKATHEEE